MTISALLGLSRPHRVRIVGTEREAAEAGRRNSLLLIVQPVAICILRTDYYGASGARGSDAMSRNSPIDSKHEDVIAQRLEVIGRVIASFQPFVVQHFR